MYASPDGVLVVVLLGDSRMRSVYCSDTVLPLAAKRFAQSGILLAIGRFFPSGARRQRRCADGTEIRGEGESK